MEHSPAHRLPSRFVLQAFPYFSLRSGHPPEKSGTKKFPEPKDKPSVVAEKAILCRQCRHTITFPAEETAVNNAHLHTFANPEGIVFEIGCFRNAPGCSYVGPASTEFTWFAGYSWRIAICANCLIHLGWKFLASEGHFFHGLITDRLSAS